MPPTTGASATRVDGPALRVQLVLFNTAAQTVARGVRAIRIAARHAVELGRIGSLRLAIGDCSAQPCLTTDDVQLLEAELASFPGASCSYTFFAANLGSAEANNRLLADRTEDLVFVLNPDAYPSPTLFAELLSPARALMAPIGIYEARQVPLEHPKYYDPATGETGWASGACSLYTAEVLQATGGFDSASFFMYCDDVDLAWRARLAGFAVVHRPAARVFHDKRLDGGGGVATTAAETRFGAEGALMLAWKYSRLDVLNATLDWLRSSPHRAHAEVLASFEARRATGALPDQLDPEWRVGEFADGMFAQHRFFYRQSIQMNGPKQ